MEKGVERLQEGPRAERDLRCEKKIGEFGEAGLVALANKPLKDFRVRPVAGVKHDAGEQGAYCSGKADCER